MTRTVGVVGLGNMGGALAANLVDREFEVITHDLAGPDRNPTGALFVGSVAELAASVPTVVFSLPDGAASQAVAAALVDTSDRRVAHVVDTSTIGVRAAEATEALLTRPASATSTHLSPVASPAPGLARSR